MYPIQPEADLIDLLQRLKNFLENYLNDREATIRGKEKEIAVLQARCHESALRLENLQKVSNQFFENRKKVTALAMTALDRAISQGDENVADIALAIIDKEYSEDFFGMMNKTGGFI